jgi:hypothetical protein
MVSPKRARTAMAQTAYLLACFNANADALQYRFEPFSISHAVAVKDYLASAGPVCSGSSLRDKISFGFKLAVLFDSLNSNDVNPQL